MHAIVMADTGRSAATRLAVRSLREHLPEARITLVLADPNALPIEVDGADTLAARDLDIDGLRYIDVWLAGGPEFARWAAVPAAITAIGSDEPTLVVPGSAWIRGSLHDLVAAVPDDAIALLSRGYGADVDVVHGGWVPSTMVAGPGAGDILGWWMGLARAALIDGSDDLDRADPWHTFVSSGGRVLALTDPTVRVAPSAVAHLDLALADGEPVSGGRPVRLMQFPGFDPTTNWWYSTGPDVDPPVLTSENEALRRLCGSYASELGSDPDTDPTPHATVGDDALRSVLGFPTSDAFRSAFTEQLRTATERGDTAPNPLDPGSAAAFFDWLRGPSDSELTGISPAADIVWRQRPDLVNAFPHVRWGDRSGYLRWLWTHGLAEGLITTAVLPPLPQTQPGNSASQVPLAPRFGVNLVGYHDSDLGLGVAVRRVGAALDAAGVPWTKVTYDRTNSRRRSSGPNTADAPYWFNLILIAPDQLAFFVEDVGATFLSGHYNIGLWFWETDVLSRRQRDALDLVDEVWGSTKYLVDVFARHTDKPVVHAPVPLEFHTAAPDPATRAELGLDDRFTFLFTFDFLSIVRRKNPLDLVDAYQRAFDVADGCRLILKSINGDRHVAEAEEIRALIAERPDVELWDRYLSASARLALVANADCYISLHRSEGLGLTMAEAMAAGTPVIASAYSGNLDFMPAGSALLVDVDEIEIGEGQFYPAHGHWAQPHLDHATALMRRIRTDEALRRSLAESGPLALRPFTAKRVGATMHDHLRELWDRASWE